MDTRYLISTLSSVKSLPVVVSSLGDIPIYALDQAQCLAPVFLGLLG